MKTTTSNGGLIGKAANSKSGRWDLVSVQNLPVVTFGSVGNNNYARSGGTATWTHTFGANETFVIVGTSQDSNPSAVTMDGVAMTNLGYAFRCSMYYAFGAPGTTHSFSVTHNGSAFSMAFMNVNNVGTVVLNPTGGSNDNGTHSITATAPVGGMVVAVSGQWSSSTAPGDQNPYTQRYWNIDPGTFVSGGFTAEGTGSGRSMSFYNGQGGAMIAVSLS